jgi:NAD(P)-dependent dehydrogenase (short-subunit alcohol dehydrogenase family)
MTQNSNSLKNQVAIVTGAGKGLGRAWAIHLAMMGASVVVNNRHSPASGQPSSADNVVEEIKALGGRAIANYDSVEDVDAATRMVDCAMEHFGSLEIIVANAGLDKAASFHQLDFNDFEYVLDVNFKSVARLLHVAWPIFRKNNYGRVLLTTSSAGLYGNHGMAGYSSSKAAIEGLMKTLAIEGRSRGILVNSIAPYAMTQMTSEHMQDPKLANALTPESAVESVDMLVRKECDFSGKTFICGANHVRLVASLASDSMLVNANDTDAYTALLTAPLKHSSASATDNFMSFVESLQLQEVP